MGRKRIDLKGQTFHWLQVLRQSETRDGYWLCRCRCGLEKVVYGSQLRSGNVKSCGCWNSVGKLVHGHCRRGLRNRQSSTYSSWLAMRSRCTDPRDPAYASYGGRGIRICERWLSFTAFLEDMGEAPKGLTLDRILVNGHYAPGNCRWATRKTQARNKRGATHHSSRFKGVVRFQDRYWRARIRVDGKLRDLGLYRDEVVAAQAYNAAAKASWGPDAYLNPV